MRGNLTRKKNLKKCFQPTSRLTSMVQARELFTLLACLLHATDAFSSVPRLIQPIATPSRAADSLPRSALAQQTHHRSGVPRLNGGGQKPDLFVPILVGVSLGGYALIVLYDIFFGNGLCGVTIECANSPWG